MHSMGDKLDGLDDKLQSILSQSSRTRSATGMREADAVKLFDSLGLEFDNDDIPDPVIWADLQGGPEHAAFW